MLGWISASHVLLIWRGGKLKFPTAEKDFSPRSLSWYSCLRTYPLHVLGTASKLVLLSLPRRRTVVPSSHAFAHFRDDFLASSAAVPSLLLSKPPPFHISGDGTGVLLTNLYS